MAPELNDLSASFMRDLRAQMRSPATIKLYGFTIKLFIDWLESTGQPATLDQLTKLNVRQWLGHLAADKQPSTVSTRFRCLRRFCNWLVTEDEIEHSPMATLSAPQPPPPPVPVLSDNELAALLKTCSARNFKDRRDEAILRVLFDTGVRVSELVGLTIQSVDLDRDMALVTGKGGKIRPVYFSPKTVRALDRYLRERRKHNHAHLDAFFLAQRGALSADGVRDRLRQRAKQAGLRDPLFPHKFRHTFAHDFRLHGGDSQDLKRLAGWDSDAMLSRYGASGADVRAREAARRLRRGDRV